MGKYEAVVLGSLKMIYFISLFCFTDAITVVMLSRPFFQALSQCVLATHRGATGSKVKACCDDPFHEK